MSYTIIVLIKDAPIKKTTTKGRDATEVLARPPVRARRMQ
jgi:hypothetical protein